jgi:hypothetical protein
MFSIPRPLVILTWLSFSTVNVMIVFIILIVITADTGAISGIVLVINDVTSIFFSVLLCLGIFQVLEYKKTTCKFTLCIVQ